MQPLQTKKEGRQPRLPPGKTFEILLQFRHIVLDGQGSRLTGFGRGQAGQNRFAAGGLWHSNAKTVFIIEESGGNK